MNTRYLSGRETPVVKPARVFEDGFDDVEFHQVRVLRLKLRDNALSDPKWQYVRKVHGRSGLRRKKGA
jgi:hypothetical protein